MPLSALVFPPLLPSNGKNGTHLLLCAHPCQCRVQALWWVKWQLELLELLLQLLRLLEQLLLMERL